VIVKIFQSPLAHKKLISIDNDYQYRSYLALIKIMSKHFTLTIKSFAVAALCASSLAFAFADNAYATKKVYSPYIEQGELEYELRF
jgi:hypothetical protein